MKLLKMLELRKHYIILFEPDEPSTAYEPPDSINIVEVHNHSTGETYFYQSHDGPHGIDVAPGGSLYLANAFDAAVEVAKTFFDVRHRKHTSPQRSWLSRLWEPK